MGNTDGSSEDWNADRNEDNKGSHEVSAGNETSIEIRPKATSVSFWKRICVHFVHVLRLYKVEFEGCKLIELAMETSRKFSIQDMAQVLLASQVKSENWETVSKALNLPIKELYCRSGNNKGIAGEKISKIQKMPNTFHQNNEKGQSRNWPDLTPQSEGYKNINSFQNFEKGA